MGLKTISPDDLYQLVKSGAATVVDVNSRQNWSHAHVPGAVNLDPFGYDAADLPRDKTSTLVFYCSNVLCRKAPNAARRARSMGYVNSYVMSAGVKGWLAANLPTESNQ
jgi:rhodanese-related sulfurtransferase